MRLKIKLLSPAERRKEEHRSKQAIKQQIEQVDDHIGRSAVEQLAWIVRLSQRELGYGEALDSWQWLQFFEFEPRKYLVGGVSPSRSPSEAVTDVREALGNVRVLICGLADGKEVRFLPERGDLAIAIRIASEGRLSREYLGPFNTRVFLRTLDLLEEAGSARLRRCPYSPKGQPVCKRVFVKRKGQRFCSGDHSAAAAYDAWVKRGKPRGTRAGRG